MPTVSLCNTQQCIWGAQEWNGFLLSRSLGRPPRWQRVAGFFSATSTVGDIGQATMKGSLPQSPELTCWRWRTWQYQELYLKGGGIKENFGGASKIGGEWNIAPDVSCKWSKVAGGWWGHKLELALHFYQLWFKTGITPKVPSYQALGSVANSWRHSLEFSLGKQDIKTSLQAPLYDLYPLVLIRQERDSWEWIQWEKPLLQWEKPLL